MDINEFKLQDVRGLYTYWHFEHPTGAFIQISHRRDNFVFQGADGTRARFDTMNELKQHVGKQNAN